MNPSNVNEEEFKALSIKAKEQIHALLAGNSLSKKYGEGYDFGELREVPNRR